MLTGAYFAQNYASIICQGLLTTPCYAVLSQCSLRFSLTVGAPTSPLNIYNIVDEYFVNYSTVTVSWDQPSDQSRVDYYLIRYMYQLSNDLTIAFNTTNTSFTQFSVSYNEIMTVSVTSFNCIGKSTPVVYNFDIGTFNSLNI